MLVAQIGIALGLLGMASSDAQTQLQQISRIQIINATSYNLLYDFRSIDNA